MNTYWPRTIVGLVLLIAICGTGRPASADLYTSNQPSLEWLVDSCDAIYEARIGPMRGIEDRNFVTHWEPYKVTIAPGPKSGFVRRSQLQKGGRWMIFFRWGPEGWHFVRAIDLDNPLAWSQTSAITAKGEVLRDRESIVRFVTERVNRKHQLPKGANPAELESILGLHEGRRVDASRDFPTNAQQRLGGYLRYQSVQVWAGIPNDEDSEEGVEEGDMFVNGLLVPADQANRDYLVDKLRLQLGGEGVEMQYQWSQLENDLWALVNYRDDEVKELLDKYNALGRENKFKGASSLCVRQTEMIERYWRYVDSSADPANQALAGRWELQLQPTDVKPSPVHPRFWVEVLLMPDHRYTATCYRVQRPGDRPEACRLASGYWLAEGGLLGLQETQKHVLMEQQPMQWYPYLYYEGPLDREAMKVTFAKQQGPAFVFRRVGDLPLAMTAE